MEKIENYIKFKKYNIYYKIVSNTSLSSEVGILYLHGKNVHSGYLEKIIEPDSNFIYFSFDNPGQGRSSGSRGNCNIYKHGPQLIKYFIENIIVQFKIKNLYIIGESSGALMGFYFINNYKINVLNIAGIIFIPAIFRIKEMESPGKQMAVSLLNIFFPELPVKNRTSFSFYTSDENKLKELSNDKYYGNKISIRFLYGIHRFHKYLKRNIHRLNIPVLFIHGKDDHYSGKKDLTAAFRRIKYSINKQIIYLCKSNHWIMIGEEFTEKKNKIHHWITKIEKITNAKR